MTREIVFCVSQNGCDQNRGTRSTPFRTLERGLAAIKILPEGAHAVLHIGKGVFRVTSPIILDAEAMGGAPHPD